MHLPAYCCGWHTSAICPCALSVAEWLPPAATVCKVFMCVHTTELKHAGLCLCVCPRYPSTEASRPHAHPNTPVPAAAAACLLAVLCPTHHPTAVVRGCCGTC